MATPAQIVLTELSGDPTALPAAGQLGLYAKSSVEGFYIINSSGTIIGPLAAGGGGGGTPAGPTGAIQYNNSGSFGGNANFVVGVGIPGGTPFSGSSPTTNGGYSWIGNNEFSNTDQNTIIVGNQYADYAVFQCEVTNGSSGNAALSLGSLMGNNAGVLTYNCGSNLLQINRYNGTLTPIVTIDTNVGQLELLEIGAGLSIAEGSNAKQGTVVLAAGTVTVSTTAVTANSRIFLTVQVLGTVALPTAIAVSNIVPGTSFDIISADLTDTSTVAYFITEAI